MRSTMTLTQTSRQKKEHTTNHTHHDEETPSKAGNKKKGHMTKVSIMFRSVFFASLLLNTFLSLKHFGNTKLIFQETMTTSTTKQNERTDMPIMRSTPINKKGFHPIFIYSNAATTNKPPDKKSYSQAKQDLLIMALIDANDAKNTKEKASDRFFVDLASNHAYGLSNSYLLEQYGYTGICIEPNSMYWYELASYRNCTIVGAFVGGSQEEDGNMITVNLSGASGGGIVGEDMDNKEAKETDVKRNIVSIKTIFEQTNVPNTIDYLSLDVEGAETIVMDKFSWDTYTFKFLTIERPKDDLQNILKTNGYRKVMDVTHWGETLWANEKEILLTNDEMKKIAKDKKLECYKCVGEKWMHEITKITN